MDIQLLDRDGFVLKRLEGPKETIWSGTTNVLQNTIDIALSPSIAKRTKRATLEVDFAKCDTCNTP